MRGNSPQKKKPTYTVNPELEEYLSKYSRKVDLQVHYEDLLRYNVSVPLLDSDEKDTLWETVYYTESDQKDLNKALCRIYALLKAEGDLDVHEHLAIARIDFCTFGNTNPFRIRIVNRLNDNYDHFYVKKADASRVYGLELEDLMSPNHVYYLVDGKTLVEAHIAGVPGDFFIENYLDRQNDFNQIRIAKEFVKFNERCFVRLLGDMRSYNFVVDITPDIDGSQFRLRCIDFDQQSYEGRKTFYLPQYFKENNPIIFLGLKHMDAKTVTQYQLEERTLIAARLKVFRERIDELMSIMKRDTISTPDKIRKLRKELADHHHNDDFLKCKSMGDIVWLNVELVASKLFKQSLT